MTDQRTAEEYDAEFQAILKLLRTIDKRVCEYNFTDDDQVELFDKTDDIIAIITVDEFEGLGCI